MVSFESGQYSVPHQLLGATVWVRAYGAGDGEQVVITHLGDAGPVEVAGTYARSRAAPGSTTGISRPPEGALERRPRPGNAAELAFLGLGRAPVCG